MSQSSNGSPRGSTSKNGAAKGTPSGEGLNGSLDAFQPAAYLSVLTDGRAEDVIGLVAGQRATIGRGDACFLRISDEKCSTKHCLVFQNNNQWMAKDLDSRNGTNLNGKPVQAEFPLFNADVIQIGGTQIQFFTEAPDLGPDGKRETAAQIDALPDEQFAVIDESQESRLLSDDGSTISRKAPRKQPESGQPDIVAQARTSRITDSELTRPRDHAALSQLLAAGHKLGQTRTIKEACKVALASLLSQTRAQFGAVLVLPTTKTADRSPDRLKLAAFDSLQTENYTRVSQSVSRLVFESDTGVLFRDMTAEDDLDGADSIRELELTSAVCVPVRLRDRIAGLLHLYSRDVDAPLDDDDFHVTLALAEVLSNVLQEQSVARQAEEKAQREKKDADKLREELAGSRIGKIVGNSPSVELLREEIIRVAPTDATVLVRGESGVGKELVGRAMHDCSRRASGPFVTMNCAALTESILESELFGHEKGSFTGATARKKGKFEQADGGTLMLDEVGEMSLEIQAKFLRVLEGHSFERVGGSESITADTRVVAATNRDLEDAVREGSFRKDLYFRLHVVVITIPPLRQRAVDIPLLAQHFIERFAPKSGRNVTGLSAEAKARLQEYRWPGNIRELQNTIERSVILSQGELIEATDVRFSALSAFDSTDELVAPEPAAEDEPFREITIDDLEKEHILTTLEATEWNKTKAAQILGIERSTLDRKLKRYGVARPGG